MSDLLLLFQAVMMLVMLIGGAVATYVLRGKIREFMERDRAQVPLRSSEELGHAGRRRINLIWETMQATIAACVTGSALYVSAKLALLMLVRDTNEQQAGVAATAFMLLSNLASLVIGFYFGRTNHSKTGGVVTGNNNGHADTRA